MVASATIFLMFANSTLLPARYIAVRHLSFVFVAIKLFSSYYILHQLWAQINSPYCLFIIIKTIEEFFLPILAVVVLYQSSYYSQTSISPFATWLYFALYTTAKEATIGQQYRKFSEAMKSLMNGYISEITRARAYCPLHSHAPPYS